MKGGLDTLVSRLTDHCSLACGYCYAGSRLTGEDLPSERVAEAMAPAYPPGGALHIQFTGGEPLLCWDTAVRVLNLDQASGWRFHAATQTNGTLFTPVLCRELRVRRVVVGVGPDGTGPDNAARRASEGKPSFQAMARGFQTLAATDMAANLTAVVSMGSVCGLDRPLDFALWCDNVHGVGLDLVRPQGRSTGAGLSPSPQVLAEGLDHLLARHDQLAWLDRPMRFKELEHPRLLLRTGCRRGCYCNAQTGHSLVVTPDGWLWSCPTLAGVEERLLGTLGAGMVLPQGLCSGLGPPEEYVRRLAFGPCSGDCSASGLCGGGCPAARRAGPSPLDYQMHRRILEHTCRLEGKLEWRSTWETTFPNREEPDDEEESQ